MNKLICILSIFLLFKNPLKSQILDTTAMLLNGKIRMLEQINSSIRRIDDIECFLKRDIPFRILKQKGFEDFLVFFEIPVSFSEETCYKFTYTDTFAFCYNSRSAYMYKLKGFNGNDFMEFFSDLSFYSFINRYEANESDLKSKKRFLKAFYIENVDLACLYADMKRQKKRPSCRRYHDRFRL